MDLHISDKVEGEIDYDYLISNFGTQRIDNALIERLERITGEPAHSLLKNGVFFSHRDLDKFLDHVETGGKCYIYTGRGPSSASLHIGHLVPFVFAKYLQQVFDATLVIQITDDEKFLFRDMTWDQVKEYALETLKDIISLDFDPVKTIVFMNSTYMGSLYPTVLRIQKCITVNQAKAIFGFKVGDDEESDCIGKIAFSATQIAPCFPSCFPMLDISKEDNIMCIVPCAIDQDPFFRIARDVAPKLGYNKPVIIHSKFIPGLNGPIGKMSASAGESAIFVNDSPQQIQKKINRAFSGGRETVEEHRRLGGNPDIDVAYQYIRLFDVNSTQEELNELAEAYRRGDILSEEMKRRAIEVIVALVVELQNDRSQLYIDFEDLNVPRAHCIDILHSITPE